MTHRRSGACLTNLLEMLRQYAQSFYDLADSLARIERLFADVEDLDREPKGLRTVLRGLLVALRSSIDEIGLTLSAKELERWDTKRLAAPAKEIRQGLAVLRDRISDELEERHFIYVATDKVPHYENFRAGWEEALVRFPIAVDVEEAQKCYALERYSACVYHLMRIAEIGVQHLGRAMKLPATTIQEPWGNIVRGVQDHVKKLPHKTYVQKKKQQRYAELADALYQVNLAWRIPAEHPRTPGDQYTEEQATESLGRVKALMRHLAVIL